MSILDPLTDLITDAWNFVSDVVEDIVSGILHELNDALDSALRGIGDITGWQTERILKTDVSITYLQPEIVQENKVLRSVLTGESLADLLLGLDTASQITSYQNALNRFRSSGQVGTILRGTHFGAQRTVTEDAVINALEDVLAPAGRADLGAIGEAASNSFWYNYFTQAKLPSASVSRGLHTDKTPNVLPTPSYFYDTTTTYVDAQSLWIDGVEQQKHIGRDSNGNLIAEDYTGLAWTAEEENGPYKYYGEVLQRQKRETQVTLKQGTKYLPIGMAIFWDTAAQLQSRFEWNMFQRDMEDGTYVYGPYEISRPKYMSLYFDPCTFQRGSIENSTHTLYSFSWISPYPGKYTHNHEYAAWAATLIRVDFTLPQPEPSYYVNWIKRGPWAESYVRYSYVNKTIVGLKESQIKTQTSTYKLEGEGYPVVVLRKDKQWVTGTDKQNAVRALTALGGSFDSIQESISENPQGVADLDAVFATFAIDLDAHSIYRDSSIRGKYAWEFFTTLYHTQVSGTSHTITQEEGDFNHIFSCDTITPYRSLNVLSVGNAPKYTFYLGEAYNIEHGRHWYGYMEKQVGRKLEGYLIKNIMTLSKVREVTNLRFPFNYYSYDSTDLPGDVVTRFGLLMRLKSKGATTWNWDIPQDHGDYLVGPRMSSNYTTGAWRGDLEGVLSAAQGRLPREHNPPMNAPGKAGFWIPIIDSVLEQLPYTERDELIRESLSIHFYLAQQTTLEWYTNKQFQGILFVVGTALTFNPVGAVAIQSFTQLVLAALKEVLITYIMKEAIEYLAEELGVDTVLILLALTSAYGALTRSVDSLKAMPFAKDALAIATAGIDAINDIMIDTGRDLQKELEELLEDSDAVMEKIKRAEELLETTDFNPLYLNRRSSYFDSQMSPETFYDVSIHQTNPGVTTLSFAETYHDTALTLPEPDYPAVNISDKLYKV